MSRTYTMNGIQYNINYSDRRGVQWLRHIEDGKFKPSGDMDLHGDALSLSTLIGLAERNPMPKEGDIVNVFHPDTVKVYDKEPTTNDGKINFLTMEFNSGV